MRAFEAFKWINARGAPLAVLALLLALGGLTHRMAITRLGMTDGRLAGADARAEGRVRFISYVDAHPWVAVLLAVLFAGSLIWLQFRQSPRWSLWLTFAFMALPVLGYAWVCLQVETTPLIWRH
jgi:hypothetical protein